MVPGVALEALLCRFFMGRVARSALFLLICLEASMFLQAIVLSTDVREGIFYDQKTGAEKPGFSVDMTVIDAVTDEKYDIQLTDGYAGFDELRDLKRQGAHADELRGAADRLRGELPQKFSQLDLEVLRIKGKQAPYLKLVCRFAVVAQVVEEPVGV